MPNLSSCLEKVEFTDRRFVGTIALRSEEITLPDGSKMALGIDGGHWVLVFQEKAGAAFKVYEFDRQEYLIKLDKKTGGEEEIKTFKQLVRYFFEQAEVENLVTLRPPQ